MTSPHIGGPTILCTSTNWHSQTTWYPGVGDCATFTWDTSCMKVTEGITAAAACHMNIISHVHAWTHHTCAHAHTNTHTHAHTHMHMHTCKYTHAHTHMHIHPYIYTCTYIHAHIHIYAAVTRHTHSPSYRCKASNIYSGYKARHRGPSSCSDSQSGEPELRPSGAADDITGNVAARHCVKCADIRDTRQLSPVSLVFHHSTHFIIEIMNIRIS